MATHTQIEHAADWVPCSRYIPPDNPEWIGPESYIHYSFSVLGLTVHGSYIVVRAYQYDEDDSIHWQQDGFEAWNLDDEIMCWRSLPAMPGQGYMDAWPKGAE